jgi:hypothetical protein
MKLPYEILRIPENKYLNENEENNKEQYYFNLGDIVTIKSNPILEKNRNSLQGIEKLVFVPPFMIITEIIKEKPKNKFKLKCLYYSHKQARFVDGYFDSEVIISLSLSELRKSAKILNDKKHLEDQLNKKDELNLSDKDKEEIKEINKTIKTKKATLEKWESWFPKDSSKKISEIVENLGSLVVVFKTLFLEDAFKDTSLIRQGQFLSPFMTIKAIEMEKGDNNIYDKQSGKVIREVSLYKIKCMWYNPIDCKFSEEWFIPEALISIEEK